MLHARPFAALLVLLPCVLLAPGTLRAGEDPPPPRAASRSGEVVEVVLADALPLSDFLTAMGHVTGLTYVWDEEDEALAGRTVRSSRNLQAPRAELPRLVRSLLASYDLGLVRIGPEGDGFVRVVDLRSVGEDAGLRLRPVTVTVDAASRARLAREDGLYVTTTVHVEHLRDLDGATPLLERIATKHGIGVVVGVEEIRAFVVTDFAPVVLRVHDAIRELDARAARVHAEEEARAAAAATDLEYVEIQYCEAAELARVLQATFAGRVDIVCDPRTNLLLLSGPALELGKVKYAIVHLDVHAPPAGNVVRVLPLKHRPAAEVVEALLALLAPAGAAGGGPEHAVRVVADETTNSLVIVADPEDLELVRTVIDELDALRCEPSSPPEDPAGDDPFAD